jgi:hypothetical protein
MVQLEEVCFQIDDIYLKVLIDTIEIVKIDIIDNFQKTFKVHFD